MVSSMWPNFWDWEKPLTLLSAALSILALTVAVLAWLSRHSPPKFITMRAMDRQARRLAPYIKPFNPSVLICLSLRGAVVASLLRPYLSRRIPAFVSMQYFSQDGVDPRIFDKFHTPTPKASLIPPVLTPGGRYGLVIPPELAGLRVEPSWQGRLLVFSAPKPDPVSLAAMDVLRNAFGAARIRDMTPPPNLASRMLARYTRASIPDAPTPADVLVALGLDAAPAANVFAQHLLQSRQLHLPAVVCVEFDVDESATADALRPITSEDQPQDPYARPISTNISHTYLPRGLDRVAVGFAAQGNALLVDDYTASGSMLGLVKAALTMAPVPGRERPTWMLPPERMATMTIAHRATEIPGRDRDNGITTYRGIPVRSLFRRSGREVRFPWNRH